MPNNAKRITRHILRWFFAVLLFTTAVGKLLDNRGFSEVLGTYRLFPSQGLLAIALAISLSELALAGLLFAYRRIRLVAAALVVIHSGYLLLAIVTLLRGIALENCGCFGVFWARPLTWWTPVEDAVLLAASVLFIGTLETGD